MFEHILEIETEDGIDYRDGNEIGDVDADGATGCDGTNYDGDCYTTVLEEDYTVSIPAISIIFQKNFGGNTIIIPPVSYCSDPVHANNQDRATCEAIPAVWFGGCDIQGYFNKSDCEGIGSSTWYECSDKLSLTESSCVSAGGSWYGAIGYGTDSWTKFYNPTTYSTINICLKIFYRNNGVIKKVSTNLVEITETGTFQTINFKFTSSEDIPIGLNAIGIYKYNGTSCDTSTDFYPNDRTEPIPIQFTPYSNLPIINW